MHQRFCHCWFQRPGIGDRSNQNLHSIQIVFKVLNPTEFCYKQQWYSDMKTPNSHLQNCRFSESAGSGICIWTNKCPKDSGTNNSWGAVWETPQAWNAIPGGHILLESSLSFPYLFTVLHWLKDVDYRICYAYPKENLGQHFTSSGFTLFYFLWAFWIRKQFIQNSLLQIIMCWLSYPIKHPCALSQAMGYLQLKWKFLSRICIFAGLMWCWPQKGCCPQSQSLDSSQTNLSGTEENCIHRFQSVLFNTQEKNPGEEAGEE